MTERFVAYYRVSTTRQEHGLDAQRRDVQGYVERSGGVLLAEFSEKESGKRADRPELLAAIAKCKAEKAILVFAKLDRLSRDAAFIFTLKAELDRAGVKIACTALPELNTLTLGIFATMAQHEREVISERTAKGLAEAKAKGKQIGRPRGSKWPDVAIAASRVARLDNRQAFDDSVIEMIRTLRNEGKTLADVASILNMAGKTAPRGGKFTGQLVGKILQRNH